MWLAEALIPATERDGSEHMAHTQTPAFTTPERRHFEWISLLGQGGFGEVHLAKMTSAGGLVQHVAVKLLHQWLDPRSMAAERLVEMRRDIAPTPTGAVCQMDWSSPTAPTRSIRQTADDQRVMGYASEPLAEAIARCSSDPSPTPTRCASCSASFRLRWAASLLPALRSALARRTSRWARPSGSSTRRNKRSLASK